MYMCVYIYLFIYLFNYLCVCVRLYCDVFYFLIRNMYFLYFTLHLLMAVFEVSLNCIQIIS